WRQKRSGTSSICEARTGNTSPGTAAYMASTCSGTRGVGALAETKFELVVAHPASSEAARLAPPARKTLRPICGGVIIVSMGICRLPGGGAREGRLAIRSIILTRNKGKPADRIVFAASPNTQVDDWKQRPRALTGPLGRKRGRRPGRRPQQA